ncbi:ent-copalyl diphosphate synthase, chloroplastic [Trifolium repens]|nr:ent-copalyl diphosphate synthase, chloroplastic [Trifolium repens]
MLMMKINHNSHLLFNGLLIILNTLACIIALRSWNIHPKKCKKVKTWLNDRDLPGEVGYALDVPWYASLPRLGTRFYLEQYGGENDVWIGKTLYRWYSESELEGFGLTKKNLLFAYYVAAASIFEPERSLERLPWTKTAALLHTLKSHFKDEETRSTFVDKLL